MSEQINSAWPFPGMEEAEEVDVSAIFGADTGGSDINPFEALAEQNPAPAPVEQDPAPAAAEQPSEPQPEEQATPTPVEEPKTQTEPVPQAQEPAAPAKEPDNLIRAAFHQQEEASTQAKAKSLFEKPPVFSYGSARDEITDGAMTFEELRIAKSDDFPELGEGKRVSWSVEYGKVTKQITDPKGTTIKSIKEEIERSKPFLDGLKKAKDKNPNCLVKPKVTAQSKGIASYKGVFRSLKEAQASDKTICLFPSGDGRVYELRKTELGEFIAPKDNIVEFQQVRAGFTPALPLIPQSLFRQIVSFFRCYMNKEEYEALAHILWDKELGQFIVHVPPQEVSKARINADLSRDELPEERYLHYADIHSHNSMAAKFSSIDDQDEQATRLYIVLGQLDRFFPEITVRMSCGGTFCELDPALIFESVGEAFPQEWRDNVKIGARSEDGGTKAQLLEGMKARGFWRDNP